MVYPIKESQTDLVLLDSRLPGSLRRGDLPAIDRSPPARVLMLSMYDDPTVVREAIVRRGGICSRMRR